MIRRRPVLAGLGVVALVLVIAVALAAAALRPARLKATLSEIVQERTQRTLRIDGDVEWRVWPQLEVRVGRTSLSEKASAAPFVAIDGARFGVALRPLLSGRVIVDEASVAGLQGAVIRHADGTFNFEDLLPKPGGRPLQIDIAGVHLDAKQLNWRDEGSGQAIAITDVRVETGSIHADTGSHAFRMASAALAGRQDGGTAALELAAIDGTATTLTIGRLGADVEVRADKTAIKARLDTSLAADLSRRTIDLQMLAGHVLVSDPRLTAGQAKLTLSGGSAKVDLAQPSAQLSIKARLDESTMAAHLDVERFSPLDLALDADIDRLDLDRYLLPAAPGRESGNVDLSALSGRHLRGGVTVGSLRMGGVTATNVRLRLGGGARPAVVGGKDAS